MKDIYKDWKYRKEDVEHVAKVYGVSYTEAENALNYIINQKKKGIALPIDAYWKQIAIKKTPAVALRNAIEEEGTYSTVIADMPAKKTEKLGGEPGKLGGEPGRLGVLAMVAAAVFVLWYFLLGRRS